MAEPKDAEHTVCKEMLDTLPFGVYAVDVKTDVVVYANRQWRANHADMGQALCYRVINGRDTRCTYCRRSELLDHQGLPNGVTLTYEFFNEFDDKWYQICESATYWDNNQVVKYVIAVDISDLKETQNRLAEAHAELALKNKELEYLANTDSLTRIYNRDKLARVFARELENLAVRHDSFAIISIDLDHFKEINDTFGHAVGDNVLISVARTMKDAIRTTDIIGRWGGEEFLILCPATNLDEARHLSQRICDEVARSRYCTGRAHSVSIGVAAYRAGDTLDSLLQRADLAMYQAKQDGRNRVCSEADS